MTMFNTAYYKACAQKILRQAANQKPMPNGVQQVGLSAKQMAAFMGLNPNGVHQLISRGQIASVKLQEPVRDADGTYYWRVVPLAEVLRVKRQRGAHYLLGSKNPTQVKRVRRVMHTKGVAVKARRAA